MITDELHYLKERNEILRKTIRRQEQEIRRLREENERQACIKHAAHNPQGDCVYCDIEQRDEEIAKLREAIRKAIKRLPTPSVMNAPTSYVVEGAFEVARLLRELGPCLLGPEDIDANSN